MKKQVKKAVLFFSFLLLFFCFSPSLEVCGAPAKEEVSPTAEAEENMELDAIKSQLDGVRGEIPPEILPFLPQGFLEGSGEEMAEEVRKGGSAKAIFGAVGALLHTLLPSSLSLFGRSVAVLLLMACFTRLGEGAFSGRLKGAFHLLGAVVLSLSLFQVGKGSFTGILAYIDTVRGLSLSFLPLMGALYAMGGNVAAAVANHSFYLSFLLILEQLLGGATVFLAHLSPLLALSDALGCGVSLRPLSAVIKKTFTVFFSFLMLLLTFSLGVQHTLAVGKDTLALRTLRFAAGSFLPLVGGTVSETLRTVAGSVTFLRSTVGTGLVLLLFFLFLPMLLSVALTRLAFSLAAAVASLLGVRAGEVLLSEFSSVYGCFLAVITVLFVVSVFALTLFSHCAVAM